MKRNMSISVLLMLGVFSSVVFAGTSFTPLSPYQDLGDLDHYSCYVWQVDYELAENEVIVGASLSISQINNWDYRETDDILNMRLLSQADAAAAKSDIPLDIVATGSGQVVMRGEDNRAVGDAFASYGIALTSYTDTTRSPEDFLYNFNATQVEKLNELVTYDPVEDMGFALSFDPDCHYWNDGITLNIETAIRPPSPPVPVPGAFLLTALGAGLVGHVRRRRSL